jgi:hypothetical protein
MSGDKVWSRPTSLFNTRIPPEMAELLDDLVYKLKKEKQFPIATKQALAQQALEDLFQKHGMLG